jgi:hypothetical protein
MTVKVVGMADELSCGLDGAECLVSRLDCSESLYASHKRTKVP